MLHPAKKMPKSNFSLSKHTAMNYDSRVQKTAQNYTNLRSRNTMEGKLGVGADETSMIEDDSGVCRTNPSTSPPHRNNINYKCLSPSSKAQAIARGQKELMEMVSKMPESCFELTLKDLVEHQDAAVEPKQEIFAEVKGHINNKEKGKEKNKFTKPQINRSGSIDNGGFLLKMVFPFSLGSKSKNKKKKNESNKNHNSKVSPKPTVSDESGKSIEKEWWKMRTGSRESENGGSLLSNESTQKSSSTGSSTGGSMGNTSRRHMRKGCLAFIFTRKSKASR